MARQAEPRNPQLPFCQRGQHDIELDMARVSDERGVSCVECLAFDNRLTENDRKFLRALRIAIGK